MFHGAESFNQPLDTWDVSQVTRTCYKFCCASSFNQPLVAWDVSHVTSMGYMFNGATSFNQPLGTWDVDYNSSAYGSEHVVGIEQSTCKRCLTIAHVTHSQHGQPNGYPHAP
jgi:surface protein